jgi:hypothetical protein
MLAVDRTTGSAAPAAAVDDDAVVGVADFAAAAAAAAVADFAAAGLAAALGCCFDENSVAFGADRVDTNRLDPSHGILLLPKAAVDNAAVPLVNRPSLITRNDLNLQMR